MPRKAVKTDRRGKTQKKTNSKRTARAASAIPQPEKIFDQLPEAVISVDRDGRIQYMNLRARSLLGSPDGNLELKDWPEHFGLYQDDRQSLFASDRLPPARALKGEQARTEQMLMRRNGAGEIWLSMTASPVSGEDGAPAGATALIHEITDFRKSELSRDRYARRIEAFYRMTRILAASTNDIGEITRSVAQLTSEVLGDLSVVTLLNRDGEKITVSAFEDTDPDSRAMFDAIVTADPEFPSDRGLAAGAIRSGEPLLIPLTSRDEMLKVAAPKFAEFVRQVSLQSVLSVPLIGRSGTLGAIVLFRHTADRPYSASDQSFLMEIAYRTALAIEHSVLVESLRTEIAARMTAKQALEATQERFLTIFESTELGVKVLDLVGTILDTNPAFQNMIGYSKAELTGRNFYDFLHPGDVDRALKFFNDLKISHLEDFRFEHRTMHKNGTVVWVKTTFTGVKRGGGDDSLAFIFGILEDITEQKHAEAEMTELKTRLHSIVELERLRVAHELHDGPMQELYSAMYRVKQLGAKAEPELAAELQEVNRDIQQVLQDLRETAKELRPPAISNFGLEKAIRSHAEDFQQQHPDIQLRLSLAQDRQLLPEDLRLALFRVYQQAMANVARHAKASQVEVRFSFDAEEVRLDVVDNGVGFKVPDTWLKMLREGHYGLPGAAERMSVVGGVLVVESSPLNSTLVRAIIPLKETSVHLPDEEQRPIIKRARDLI